jgi:predicted PurR-regulated permease PerM
MLDSLNKLPRFFTIGLAFPVIFLNGWLLLLLANSLQPLVSTLIAATLIAFLLDYPIRFLQQRGVSRGISVAIVLLLFVVLVTVMVIFLGPVILRQANELLTRLPEWLKSGQNQLKSLELWARDQQLPIDFSTTNLNQLIERLTSVLRSLTSQVVTIVFSAIGSIVNIFLSVALTIFIVLRGESLWNGILSWLPNKWSRLVRESLPKNFERFIAGQVTLASIIGVAQTTIMMILQVPLAQLFGFGIGIGSLIPLGGITVIITVSLLLALQNFWLGVKVLVFAILINQVCENLLGPRIVGELTGLNPVWMLISLDLGIKLGGALGLLVAVPIASFIKATFDTVRSSDTIPWLLATEASSSVSPASDVSTSVEQQGELMVKND